MWRYSQLSRTLGRTGVCGAAADRPPDDVGRGERGAALVEMALLLPLLVLLTFGVIEFSQLFSASATVSNASRSGARTASAEPRQTNFAKDTAAAVGTALSQLRNNAPQQVWIFRANPGTGMPYSPSGDFSTMCTQCVVYAWDSGSRTFNTAAPVVNDWAATAQNACAGTADEIGVYVKANFVSDTNLFGTAKTLTAKTVMRFEPVPSSSTCS
jgi:Flp pilus assembly protein TadG